MKRSAFAVLAPGMFGALALPVRAQSASSRVRVGTIPIDNGAEVFYALDQGIFKKAGLDVEVTPMGNGGAIVAAVAGGALDIGFTNLFSFVTAYAKGIPMRIVAPGSVYLSSSPAQVLVVAKDAPYRSGKDLNGKTVACDGLKGITQITASAWIDAHGGDSSSVKWVEVPLPAMPAALAQKRIDAASGVISDFSVGTPASPDRILGYPYDAIASRFLASGFVASKAWADAHPDVVRRFNAAILETAKWANAHQNESGTILMKVAKLTPERIAQIAKNRAPYAETLSPELIEPVIAFSLKYKIIDKGFPPNEAIDSIVLLK